jgi:hypothetical protein
MHEPASSDVDTKPEQQRPRRQYVAPTIKSLTSQEETAAKANTIPDEVNAQ